MAISEFSGSGRFQADLTSPVGFNAIEEVLIKYAKLIADDASENLNRINKYGSDSNASGSLQESITVSPVKFAGGVYSIQISLLKYYEWVNEGRPRGKRPPISDIKKWIIQKQLRLDDGGVTRNGYKRDGTLISKSKKKVQLGKSKVDILDAVAYKIAAKIGARGTEPTNFFSDAINRNKEALYKAMAEALKQDVIQTFKKK
jgi:hypothetical protein